MIFIRRILPGRPLGEYVSNLQNSQNKGKARKENPEYKAIKSRKYRIGKKIKKAKDKGEHDLALKLITDWKSIGESQRSIPSKDPYDPNYRRLWYSRYADDFVLGYIGTKRRR